MKPVVTVFVFVLAFLLLSGAGGAGIDGSNFGALHAVTKGMSTGDRIAFWASRFIGTPYDPDPRGAYVTRADIVADDEVDCMYLTFRSAELALSSSHAEAVETALTLRFRTHGRLDRDGKVENYEDRFEYAIDMIRSGKWGRDVSAEIAPTTTVAGARGIERVEMVNRAHAVGSVNGIRNGDILYFVKDPAKRIVGEIIGHIGIAAVEGEDISLIHAGGTKNGSGRVKKVRLREYLNEMPFVGMIVTRFE